MCGRSYKMGQVNDIYKKFKHEFPKNLKLEGYLVDAWFVHKVCTCGI